MISLELWRAKIGLFNCSRPPSSSLFRNLYQQQQQSVAHGWFLAGGGSAGLFSSLCRSLLIKRAPFLLLVAVITHLLLSAGDVEQNPGPISRDAKPTRQELQHMSYTSEDGKTVPFRLMDRIRPRVTSLAVALDFPQHVIEYMETKRDQVLYILGEWLEGRNQEHDRRPLTWGTLITALQHAHLIEEARILEDHFIATVPLVSERGAVAAGAGIRPGRTDSPDPSAAAGTARPSGSVVAVLAVLVGIIIAIVLGSSHVFQHATPPTQPSSSSIVTILQAATPPTQPSSSSTVQQITSAKALLDEFPIAHITEPLTLCSCLNNDDLFTTCRQIFSDHHMQAKIATMKILGMWINQSPKLTWKDVVETLFCYRLVNKAVPLAERHGVDWEPIHDKSRKN